MERSDRIQPRRPSAASDEKLVTMLVSRIREIARRHGVGAALEMGDLVIEHLYGGDLEMARAGRPVRDGALQLLEQRLEGSDVPIGTVRICVPLAVQYRDLSPQIGDALTLRQHRALLPIADPEDKRRVAAKAVASALSDDQIRAMVRAERGHRTPPGRRPKPALEKALDAALRLLASPEIDDALLSRAVKALSDEERQRVGQRARAARERIERIADAVARAG